MAAVLQQGFSALGSVRGVVAREKSSPLGFPVSTTGCRRQCSCPATDAGHWRPAGLEGMAAGGAKLHAATTGRQLMWRISVCWHAETVATGVIRPFKDEDMRQGIRQRIWNVLCYFDNAI